MIIVWRRARIHDGRRSSQDAIVQVGVTANSAQRYVAPLLHGRLRYGAVVDVAVCVDCSIDAPHGRLVRVGVRMCIVLREYSHYLVGFLRLSQLKHVDHAESGEVYRAGSGTRIWDALLAINVLRVEAEVVRLMEHATSWSTAAVQMRQLGLEIPVESARL